MPESRKSPKCQFSTLGRPRYQFEPLVLQYKDQEVLDDVDVCGNGAGMASIACADRFYFRKNANSITLRLTFQVLFTKL